MVKNQETKTENRQNGGYYNQECLNRWGITPEQEDALIRDVRCKGYRLNYDEKAMLFFYSQEYGLDLSDEFEKARLVEDDRQSRREMEADMKLVREFVKEVRRLERKYDGFDYEDKTLDELTDMWCENYFELYFLADHLDCIKDVGPKKYAQYYLHIRGVVPSDEVTLWEK